MMEQAQAFLDESEALHALLRDVPEDRFSLPTGFKGWTITEIIRHLHVWNIAADLSLTDEEGLMAFLNKVMPAVAKGGGLRPFEEDYLGGLSGKPLVDAWRAFYRPMAERFGSADPSARVKWAGPSMSVRSSITARLMETWAHGQAIYDLLGVERQNRDHIRNIVVLGVNTYGWTFKNRQITPPEPMPHLVLSAPSGSIWTFGEASETNRIEGRAEEFCQVVTQSRHIADTSLMLTGDNARQWMEIAQCFAGPPEQPPAPGTRKRMVI